MPPLAALFLSATLRRTLAAAVAVAQLLGTIGVVPLCADAAENSSTPYPCKDHPCGCQTAAQCWSGACNCMTIREKVSWAWRHGITPPKNVVNMAEDEAPAPVRSHDAALRSCCQKGLSAASEASCCSTQSARHESDPEPSHSELGDERDHRTNWVMSLFAQKCHGEGGAPVGVLNVGYPPCPPASWRAEPAIVETCKSIDHVPVPLPSLPLVPPPRV